MNVCNSLAAILKCKAHHDINDVLLNLNGQAITMRVPGKTAHSNIYLMKFQCFHNDDSVAFHNL